MKKRKVKRLRCLERNPWKEFRTSKRQYCGVCKKKTGWNYKASIGHSECSKCGFRDFNLD